METISRRKSGNRRKNGYGSVYFSRAHDRWIGQYTIRHPSTGQAKRATVYADDKDQALTRVGIAILECQKNPLKTWEARNGSSSSNVRTVADLIVWTFEANSLKASTKRRYESVIATWILPKIGHVPIHDVTPDFADNFVKEMVKTNCRGGIAKVEDAKTTCARSKQLAFDILNRVFSRAVKKMLLDRNPFLGTDRPKYKQEMTNAIALKDLECLLRVAKMRNVWEEIAFALATGLRWGEQFALKWEDVEEGKIAVRRTLSEQKAAGESTTPKTFDSQRILRLSSLDGVVSKILNSRRLSSNSIYVFSAPNGGTHQYANFYNRIWRPLVQAAGLSNARVSWHDLRHTFASYAVASLIPIPTVAAILGHAKSSFTLDRYCHDVNEDAENIDRYKSLISDAPVSTSEVRSQ